MREEKFLELRGKRMIFDDLKIIYEDGDIIIIDKPSGITVNRSDTTSSEVTVQDWAERQFKIQNLEFRVEQGDFYNRGGVVHRLDKETSGCLILAKNPEVFIKLQHQFKERMVGKIYFALVHGRLLPKEGEIRLPVGRLSWNRKRFGIIPGGRESVTFYKVRAYFQNSTKKESYSYVELTPKTGRTHQIRVHLKYFGYPIFSDFLYAGRKTAKRDRKILNRVFLHAAKISFIHPRSGEKVLFESPLPVDLELTLKQLERIE